MELAGGPLLIVVATADVPMTAPEDVERIRAFLVPGGVALNIGRGVWHDGAYPVLETVDLLNVQGADHPVDTEILSLREKFDVELRFRF
jgi:ureidoglycolate hydrolase